MALRGFTGVMKGEAVERLFDERFGGLTAGDLPIPLATIVYNTDLGLTEYFWHPHDAGGADRALGAHNDRAARLHRVGRGARTPVRRRRPYRAQPTQPAIEHGPFDHVFGLNFMLPEGLQPDDLTGWQERPMGIVRASRQLQQAYHVEFARRAERQLGDALTIIDAADPRLCRGAWLYDLFIDRSSWPELIRIGYERTTRALWRRCGGHVGARRLGRRRPRPAMPALTAATGSAEIDVVVRMGVEPPWPRVLLLPHPEALFRGRRWVCYGRRG